MPLSLTLLDRYIFKRLLDYFLLGVVVFTLLLFFSDALLDFMKDLQHYGIPWDVALTLIGLQLPKIVSTVIPMGALLATLMVYNSLNNQFELIAMRMSGISLYRLAMPAVVVGVLSALSAYLLHDFVVPRCNAYSRALKTYAINQQNLPATQDNFTYKQYDDQQQLKRLIYISRFDGSRLGYATVVDLTNPKTLQVVQAQGGTWGRQSLELENATVYTVASTQKLLNTTFAQRLQLQHFIRPQRPVTHNKVRELSFFGLWRWIAQHRRQGEALAPAIDVELWEKLTVPLSALPLVLLAIPLAMTSPRKVTNLGFLMAVLLLFGYYLMRYVSKELGNHELLPPLVATLLPLVVMGSTACTLFHRKNRML